MNIDITPETERIVREELGLGHFRSVDELILFGVRAWRERRPPLTQGKPDRRNKAEEFVAWAKSHTLTPPLPDEAVSRESLNPDRW
jgi:hypothetical protein